MLDSDSVLVSSSFPISDNFRSLSPKIVDVFLRRRFFQTPSTEKAKKQDALVVGRAVCGVLPLDTCVF